MTQTETTHVLTKKKKKKREKTEKKRKKNGEKTEKKQSKTQKLEKKHRHANTHTLTHTVFTSQIVHQIKVPKVLPAARNKYTMTATFLSYCTFAYILMYNFGRHTCNYK